MADIEIGRNQVQTRGLGMQLRDGNLARIGTRIERLPTSDGAVAAATVVYEIHGRRVAREAGIKSPHIGGSFEAEGFLYKNAFAALQSHYENTGEVPFITEGSPIIRVKALPEKTIVRPAAIKK